MTQYLLDANGLLRYLRNDIPSQAKEVRALFALAKKSEVIVEIPLAVILESVFVLSKFYGEKKERVGSELFDIISNPALTVEKREIVKHALLIWKTENISFVDCLVLAQAKEEGKRLFTFDRKLAKLVK